MRTCLLFLNNVVDLSSARLSTGSWSCLWVASGACLPAAVVSVWVLAGGGLLLRSGALLLLLLFREGLGCVSGCWVGELLGAAVLDCAKGKRWG